METTTLIHLSWTDHNQDWKRTKLYCILLQIFTRLCPDYADTHTHIQEESSLWTCSPWRKALWTYMQSKEKALVTCWKRKLWTCPTKTFEYVEQQQLQKNQIECPGTTKTTFWERETERLTHMWLTMTIKITNPQSCNKIPPKREVEETTKRKKFMQMLLFSL